nr:putative internal virion protein [uncultured Mediterranean phage uvMED]
MSKKCLLRVEELLRKSSIKAAKKDEIINQIKIAQAEKRITSIDEINVDKVAQEVSEQIKLEKKINKRNALENEIKGRKYVEYILDNFNDNPQEGLVSILVGTNRRVAGARSAVSVQQHASVNQLIAGFNQKLRQNNVTTLFEKMDKETQRRVVRTMYELNQKKTYVEELTGLEPPVKETNPDILKLAKIMEEYSETIRLKLNDRGANIQKLWGYIVRQSHDPYSIRDAAKKLGKNLDEMEADPNLKGSDINYNKNFTAWKNFVLEKLDKERTFAGVDDIDQFMLFAYNSLVKNENLRSDGADFSYGARATKDVAKSSKFKRVLHFKTADDWFDYNDIFGVGNLKESFFSGLQTAGRNMGIMDTLGTKPSENFEKIRKAVAKRMIMEKRDQGSVSSKQFDKFLKVVDGSIYTVENFGVAKYSAIARALSSMAKLGGATVSAAADIGLYGSEMRYQGKSFLGGMFEAMSSLARIKNTKQKKDIAEMLGFIADNTIYDIAGRYQVGDNLSKGFTKAQRFFFKVNLLSWWTNTLKEGAMLGMANYFAKQKNLSFDSLNPQLKNLFKVYNIDSTKWNIIRKTAMEKADDGTEFINIGLLDQISDADVKKITGIDDLTAREIGIEKDKFKASVSGMLLDRSIYAVIEPDARVRATMTQGQLAGTAAGEALRFFFQFKAFPLSIVQKVLGRELDYFKGGKDDIQRGIVGMGAIVVTSGLLGYLSMTIKDFLKGRSPRDPTKTKTVMAAFLQGGGLGIYGDVLFQETRSGGDILGQLAGPVPLTAFDLVQAIKYGIRGEGGKAGRTAYRAVSQSIPFLNLFYLKTAFDYLIGYSIMETMSPGTLRRMENRMRRDYNQEFLLTKPSSTFKGF